jgi:opacity protein-like surface antigen
VSRRLIAIPLVVAGRIASVAHAQPAPAPAADSPGPAPASPPVQPAPAGASPPPATSGSDEIGDQGIAAELGLAAGGRVTPGGLRVTGHYLYQLSERDWFDGVASFTFGSGQAACFRDRQNALVCSHGLADGSAIEISVSVRRLFAPQGAFRPFVRAGVGVGLVRFTDDDVSGLTVPLHGGGGVRVAVAPAIAVVAEGELALGVGGFNRGLGGQPQLGFAVTAGAEFRLK